MLKTKILLCLVVVISVVSLVLPACSPSAPVKVIELKFANAAGPTNFVSIVCEKWAQKLSEASKGQIKVTLYLNESLGKMMDQWNMVRTGICDISWLLTSYYQGVFPLVDALDLPFIIPEEGNIVPVLNTIYDKYLYKQFQETKVLYIGETTGVQLHTKKPVNVLADLKDKQIRTPPGVLSQLMKLLGGTPAMIPAPEVYDALSKGIADGAVMPYEAAESYKLTEVTTNHTEINILRGLWVIAMNTSKWNSLSPDLQKVFTDLNSWAQQEMENESKKQTSLTVEKLKKAGHTIIKLPPDEFARWVAATKSYNDATLTKLDGQGLPATALAKEVSTLLGKK